MTDSQRIYYLGGFPEGTILQSKQVGFHLPPIGGYLEVEDFRAKDLLRRNTNFFTINPRIAAMAARGEDYTTYEEVQAAVDILSIDDLKRLLAEKEAEEALDAQANTAIAQELQKSTAPISQSIPPLTQEEAQEVQLSTELTEPFTAPNKTKKKDVK